MHSKNKISAPTTQQATELFDAISGSGTLAEITRILEARPDAANWVCPATLTPLIQATRTCRHDVMKLLISYDAKVDAKTDDGHSAMLYTGRHGDATGAAILKAAGADIDDSLINGQTALVLAIANEKIDTALGLIMLGADVNKRYSNGLSILIDATYKGQASVCAALINAGANLFVHEKDGDQTTALDIARFMTAGGGGNKQNFIDTYNVLLPAYDALKRKTDHAMIERDLKTGTKARVKVMPKIVLKR